MPLCFGTSVLNSDSYLLHVFSRPRAEAQGFIIETNGGVTLQNISLHSAFAPALNSVSPFLPYNQNFLKNTVKTAP
jgi:hypothetical protein